jgi:hypothetical protein
MARQAELYVYGIAGAAVRPPSGKGIGRAPVRMVASEDIAAIVSEVEPDALDAGKQELLTHSKVLERAFSRGAVLPMRFGVVIPDQDLVRSELLEPFHDELAEQLQALDGKVELHVRAVYEEQALMEDVVEARPEIGARSQTLRDRPPDASYYERIELGQLVAEAVERIREQDTAVILDALEPLAVASSVGGAEHERVAADLAFLVERARMKDFDQAVDDIGRDNEGRLKVHYTGPLPPYSFVELPAQV